MKKTSLLFIAGLVLLAVIFHGLIGSPKYKMQTKTFSRDRAASECRTSQINVTSNRSVLDVGVITNIYFTNTGATCQLNQIGPSISFLQGTKTLFPANSTGTNLRGAYPLNLVSGYTVYAALLLSSPKGNLTSCGKVVTSTGVEFGEVGTPQKSLIRLSLSTNDLCSTGANFLFYAY
jgi:hypothetical protein